MGKKIGSVEELQVLREQMRQETSLREGLKDIQITVHTGTCGIAAGARDILSELAAEIERQNLKNVTLRHSGCIGLCDREPMLTLKMKDGEEFRYGSLDKRKVQRIVQDHIVSGNPVTEYLIKS